MVLDGQQNYNHYTTQARQIGLEFEFKRQLYLFILAAPKIKPVEPILAAIGAPARLPCTINAVPAPPPEGLHWFRRDVIVKSSAK